MNLLRFIAVTVWLMLGMMSGISAPAAAQTPMLGQTRHIAIRLVAESDRPAPGGTVTLAFDSRPEAGWHGYWKNPGDAGVETQLDWRLPKGVTAGPLTYPVPQRLSIQGIMNYVYEGPFTQFVTLTLAPDLTPGTVLPITVKATYLVCTDEICVPENQTLSTTLTVGDGAVPADRRVEFDRWRMALPRPLGSPATFQRIGQGEAARVRLAIPFPAGAALKDGYFFPLTQGAIDYAAPQTLTRDGDRLVIEVKAAVEAPPALTGVLKTGEGQGLLIEAKPDTVPPAKGGAGGIDWAAIALALGGALLGGLILNIMPCVFPILSLKALSLAKAKTDEAEARREALAYTGGAVLVCLALGGLILGLRAGGATIGWAFQLQDPRVILFLLVLVTGIALNLAGLFELNVPGPIGKLAASGSGSAFATGALAAFIATPCTGPFMAAALGAALVLPAPAALAVFAGLGLGLALPFLAIGFVPALRRRLPKPGAWMARLRHILSVPMALTALALAWILWRQAGPVALALGAGVVLIAVAALWWVGRGQRLGRSGMLGAGVLAIALVAGTALLPTVQVRSQAVASDIAGAEPFSEARLAQLRAQGRPVFAYFTADWCLTCKVNEKTVIETAAVERALKQGKVAVLVGDWTNGDPALGRFIEAHNRAGVPLYLWYAPGAAEPEILPQILTQQLIEDRAATRKIP